ncbi:MAG: hypothetical protein JSC188_000772 [Candidatus Tokpelaia sp. JSC188]|nr:MAG: hypothetical protein JSC188_000772 [Candidatus Tokpelaia sp. JSC188]
MILKNRNFLMLFRLFFLLIILTSLEDFYTVLYCDPSKSPMLN